MIDLDDDTAKFLATDSPHMPKPLYVAQEIVMAAIQSAQRPMTCQTCKQFESDEFMWCDRYATNVDLEHFCNLWEARR